MSPPGWAAGHSNKLLKGNADVTLGMPQSWLVGIAELLASSGAVCSAAVWICLKTELTSQKTPAQ